MTRLSICFLCSEYPPARHGGIGTMTLLLARGLATAGHSVRVVGLYDPEPGERPAAVETRDGDVRVHRLPTPPGRAGWMRGRRMLYRCVAGWSWRGEIDVVEAPDWEAPVAGWSALPVPVLVRCHGSATYFAAELGRRAPPLTRLLDRLSLRRADAWCAVSAYAAARTASLLRPARPAGPVLYNPVELAPPVPWAARSPATVVFSGTLTPKKGILSLLSAWALVLDECPGAALEVFGREQDGETARAVAAAHARLGAATGSVRFHGHVGRPTLRAALGRARAAVFPSYAEAFAIAPLEAMSSGCPTVYSRRGSGPELVTDGHDGLLIEPDDPRDIAAALVRLLRDDEFAARLGERGRRTVEQRFAIDVLLGRNEAWYRHAIAAFRAERGGVGDRVAGTAAS